MLDIIKNIIRKERLIQFSPIRSGSTLVYNIVREVFPNREILKTHRLTEYDLNNVPIITTYRNPIDSLCSCLLRFNMKPTQPDIVNQIDQLKKNGLDGLVELFKKDNVLKLQYELFYNRFEVVFSAIEVHFGIEIDQDLKQRLSLKYQVRNIQKNEVDQLSNFMEYDEKSHWHGNHISIYKGEPGSSKDFFSLEQRTFIARELRDYMEFLGYSTDMSSL